MCDLKLYWKKCEFTYFIAGHGAVWLLILAWTATSLCFFCFFFLQGNQTSAKAWRIEQQSVASISKSAGGRSGIHCETVMPLAVRPTAASTLAPIVRVLTHARAGLLTAVSLTASRDTISRWFPELLPAPLKTERNDNESTTSVLHLHM